MRFVHCKIDIFYTIYFKFSSNTNNLNLIYRFLDILAKSAPESFDIIRKTRGALNYNNFDFI